VIREPDSEGGPDLGGGSPPDEFEAIVSRWRSEGAVPEWPRDERHAAALFEPRLPAAMPAPEDDHFIPPEPPPLPRLGPPALVGLTLLALGLVLVISPGWLGVSAPYGLPLGLIALAAGLGWLVLRLWPDPPEYHDEDPDDDGAVL
jgi:hypothetical protein